MDMLAHSMPSADNKTCTKSAGGDTSGEEESYAMFSANGLVYALNEWWWQNTHTRARQLSNSMGMAVAPQGGSLSKRVEVVAGGPPPPPPAQAQVAPAAPGVGAAAAAPPPPAPAPPPMMAQAAMPPPLYTYPAAVVPTSPMYSTGAPPGLGVARGCGPLIRVHFPSNFHTAFL